MVNYSGKSSVNNRFRDMTDTGPTPPSAWISRFLPLIPAKGTVLDLACGAGRHVRLIRDANHPVVALDRRTALADDLADDPGIEAVKADLEDGSPWPLGERLFDGIIVANYLHRPLFPVILGALASQGVLIYETFSAGNEAFGKPSNPKFLLTPGELLSVTQGRLRVIAYEDGVVDMPRPAVLQRICAINQRQDVDPAVLPRG
jgi:SAM-dependent methyltransferase